MRDLKTIGMKDWYAVCQDRERWSSLCAVVLMKWHNAEKRTPALQTEHPRKGTFSVIVEDISDDTRHRHFCDV